MYFMRMGERVDRRLVARDAGARRGPSRRRRTRSPARGRAGARDEEDLRLGRGAEAQREGARRARHAGRSRPQRHRPRLRVRHGPRPAVHGARALLARHAPGRRSSRARWPATRDRLDALASCFPAGTVSGAPKVRAMQIIARARADAPRHLRGRRRLSRLRGQPRFLHRDPHGRDGERARPTSRPAPASSPTRTPPRNTRKRGTRLAPSCRRSSWRRTDSERTHGFSCIDNYDSFTYNLVQYLGELGQTLDVRRNDQVTLDEIAALRPSHIVISPGPGRPEDAGITPALIERFGPTVPILGVCLGHQAIGLVCGGKVVRAPVPMHGKTSTIDHDGTRRLRRAGEPHSRRRGITRWSCRKTGCPRRSRSPRGRAATT